MGCSFVLYLKVFYTVLAYKARVAPWGERISLRRVPQELQEPLVLPELSFPDWLE